MVNKIKTDTGLATLGTQDKNRHEHGNIGYTDTYRLAPGNIGYTRLNQILAWQYWVYKIKIDTGLATLGTHDTNRHWPGNIG